MEKLSAAGIPFMLVGSVAASYHGHPRSTLDSDAERKGGRLTLGIILVYYSYRNGI
jgi:hypothetical protein